MDINHWLVDIVDNGVERGNCVLRNLTEQDIIVVGALLVDSLVVGRVSKEVNTFALELDFFTIGDLEFLVATGVDDLARLGDLVGGLIVNENARWTFSLEEGVEEHLRGAFEDFHRVVLS
jgi:hypothetical protein